jgi:fatty-acyl-CoA synthase
MAAVVAHDSLDLPALHKHLARTLPEYACPVFLRIGKEIDVTTTFKQKKLELVAVGFDPSKTADPLYFNDPRSKIFAPLDAALYEQIVTGQLRL